MSQPAGSVQLLGLSLWLHPGVPTSCGLATRPPCGAGVQLGCPSCPSAGWVQPAVWGLLPSLSARVIVMYRIANVLNEQSNCRPSALHVQALKNPHLTQYHQISNSTIIMPSSTTQSYPSNVNRSSDFLSSESLTPSLQPRRARVSLCFHFSTNLHCVQLQSKIGHLRVVPCLSVHRNSTFQLGSGQIGALLTSI